MNKSGQDMAEKPIKDLKGHIHFLGLIWLDELEQRIQQVLPDVFILVLLHGTLNLHSQVANLVNVSSWNFHIKSI